MGKRTREKLAALDRFLRQKHGLPLYRAVSVSEARFNDVLSGREEADFKLCLKVADYFFIPVDVLLDDEKELPQEDVIQVDEDLLSVQRNDVENDIQRQKQRHFIRRNWKMIGYKKRIKLIASVLVIAIPLVAYDNQPGKPTASAVG